MFYLTREDISKIIRFLVDAYDIKTINELLAYIDELDLEKVKALVLNDTL